MEVHLLEASEQFGWLAGGRREAEIELQYLRATESVALRVGVGERAADRVPARATPLRTSAPRGRHCQLRVLEGRVREAMAEWEGGLELMGVIISVTDKA